MAAISKTGTEGLKPEVDGLAFRWAVLTLILGGITTPIFWLMSRMPETPIELGKWALVVLSAFANIIVIVYHYTIPPHPKFLMIKWRRVVLRIHIISGTVSLVAGLFACFSGNTTAALIQGAASLFFHVPSAFFQTRIVFGSKAIMVPAYILCIVTHGFCAAMLLKNPESTMWAVNTFLVFNVYVWCRIYFYLFDWWKLFPQVKYTLAILAAGATMIPALFGSLGFILLVTFIGLYLILYRWLFIRSPEAYDDFVRERARDSALPKDLSGLWKSEENDEENEDVARKAFESFDRDGDGQLNRSELTAALQPWGISATAIESYAERLLEGGAVTFDRFQSDVWSIGAVRQQAGKVEAIRSAETERDRAELVFRHLDLDGDGEITAHELDVLLIEWGLPRIETERYLKRADKDGSGGVNFEEFRTHMRPVWRYIYYDIFSGEAESQPTEMIGRSVTAMLNSKRTRVVRDRVKEQLLSHVPFLENAEEELISDLASSVVTLRYERGDVIFREGERGDTFFLVADGVARVSKEDEVIADLSVGGCLGEGALLSDDVRGATVSAQQSLTLLRLSRSSFEYLTEKYPEVRANLEKLHASRKTQEIARRIERNLLAQTPVLQGAHSDLIGDLAAVLTHAKYEEGDEIIREGEEGDRFYLLETGSVAVSRSGIRVANLGPGGCFGEGALLSDERRTATVTAESSGRVFTLEGKDFREIVARYPDFRDNLERIHDARRNS